LCPYLVGEKVLYLDLLKEFSTAQCDRDNGDDRKGDESALGEDDDEKHAAQNNRQSQPKGDGFEQLHQHNQPKKKKTGQRRRTGSLINEEFTKQPRWRAREWRGVEERVGNNRR
jgi:hypothetical protein